MRGMTGERERWRAAVFAGAWLFSMVLACKERNPDFDGPATTNDTGAASTSSDASTSTGPVVTGDGTSSGESPGTSSGEPGTSSGEPTDGSTTGCMGMSCAGECVDVMIDPDNCGMCNNKCPGQQVCVDGECMQS